MFSWILSFPAFNQTRISWAILLTHPRYTETKRSLQDASLHLPIESIRSRVSPIFPRPSFCEPLPLLPVGSCPALARRGTEVEGAAS